MARQVVNVPRRPRGNPNQARDIILAGQAISQSLSQAANSILAFRQNRIAEEDQKRNVLLGSAQLVGGVFNLPPQARNEVANVFGLKDLPKDEQGGAIFPETTAAQLTRLTEERKLKLIKDANAGVPQAVEALAIMEGRQEANLSPMRLELQKMKGNISLQVANIQAASRENAALTNALASQADDTLGSGYVRSVSPQGDVRLISVEEARRRGLDTPQLSIKQAKGISSILGNISETDLNIMKSAEANLTVLELLAGPDAKEMMTLMRGIDSLDIKKGQEIIDTITPTLIGLMVAKGVDPNNVDAEELFGEGGLVSRMLNVGTDPKQAKRFIDSFDRGVESFNARQDVLDRTRQRLGQQPSIPRETPSLGEPAELTTPRGTTFREEIDRSIAQGVEAGMSVQQIENNLRVELNNDPKAMQLVRERINAIAGDILRTNPPAP